MLVNRGDAIRVGLDEHHGAYESWDAAVVHLGEAIPAEVHHAHRDVHVLQQEAILYGSEEE